MDDPELYSSRFKPELTDDEKIRLSAYWITFVRMRENNWFQYQNGVLDDVTWESYRSSIVGSLSSPRARTWWQNYAVGQMAFDAEFVSLVDNLLADVPVQEQSALVAAFD